MTEPNTQSSPSLYAMHSNVELAYRRLHDWFDADPRMRLYKSCDRSDARRALFRNNPKDAAFNYSYYFATHCFKACHALQSNAVIGLRRLAVWLRYNPYLTVIDIGCGDGAGSVAVIDSVLRLREKFITGHFFLIEGLQNLLV